jgi:mutual gliding-motility protein MglA
MPYIAYEKKEINFKVVYCGPGMSGKTTNLSHIHRTLSPGNKGGMVMLNTREERTLFFDFFPLELGTVCGFKLRFNMYTVPGQSYYEASRRLVLDGADAVVFVADSQPRRLGDNLESFRQTEAALASQGQSLRRMPFVLQYNKRDCGSPLAVGTLEQALALNGVPVFTAVASQGQGVMETIRRTTQLLMERFRK